MSVGGLTDSGIVHLSDTKTGLSADLQMQKSGYYQDNEISMYFLLIQRELKKESVIDPKSVLEDDGR